MAQKLDRLAREADEISTKIEGAYEKLINKLQSKSDKAREDEQQSDYQYAEYVRTARQTLC